MIRYYGISDKVIVEYILTTRKPYYHVLQRPWQQELAYFSASCVIDISDNLKDH